MLAILSTDHLEVIDDTFGTAWCTRTLCQLALMVDVPNDVTALPVLKECWSFHFVSLAPAAVYLRSALGDFGAGGKLSVADLHHF